MTNGEGLVAAVRGARRVPLWTEYQQIVNAAIDGVDRLALATADRLVFLMDALGLSEADVAEDVEAARERADLAQQVADAEDALGTAGRTLADVDEDLVLLDKQITAAVLPLYRHKRELIAERDRVAPLADAIRQAKARLADHELQHRRVYGDSTILAATADLPSIAPRYGR